MLIIDSLKNQQRNESGYQQKIKDLRVVVMKQVGHRCLLDAPEEFNRYLLEFATRWCGSDRVIDCIHSLNRFMLRYLSPLSGRTVATLPYSPDILNATSMLAPALMPTSRPYSFESLLAVCIAS